jgi:hypothetical protein
VLENKSRHLVSGGANLIEVYKIAHYLSDPIMYLHTYTYIVQHMRERE